MEARGFGGGEGLLLRYGEEVYARLLLNQAGHGSPAEGFVQTDGGAIKLRYRPGEYLPGDMADHILGEVHDVFDVLIGGVQLHGGKFGVMAHVHPLVAEDAADLIDLIEAPTMSRLR